MRCPDCNKFVSLELGDVEDIEVNLRDQRAGGGLASLIVEARIVRTCQECGTELKEASFEMEADATADLTAHEQNCMKREYESSADLSTSERSEGKGRGMKSFYGVEGDAKIVCACGDEVGEYPVADEIQASAMEEMV